VLAHLGEEFFLRLVGGRGLATKLVERATEVAQGHRKESGAAAGRVAESERGAALAVSSHESRGVLGVRLDVVEGERQHCLLHGRRGQVDAQAPLRLEVRTQEDVEGSAEHVGGDVGERALLLHHVALVVGDGAEVLDQREHRLVIAWLRQPQVGVLVEDGMLVAGVVGDHVVGVLLEVFER